MGIPPGVVSKLIRLQWLDNPTVDAAVIEAKVREYQTFHGLVPDGYAGPITQRHMGELRFCGLRDNFTTGEQTCAWPHKKITWNITGQLPSMSAADQKEAYALAWSFWAAVCGVQPEYVSQPNTANVLMGAGKIDQPGGTLAWSELPCGASASSQLKQLYGTEEPYGVFDVGEQAHGRIDLVRVACHEEGHVLGLPHASGGGQLLSPTYNAAIRKPQSWDIAEVVKRYGPPVAVPPPIPTPVPPGAYNAYDADVAVMKALAAATGHRVLKI